MQDTVIIALISSFAALIVATIGFISSKKSTKVEAMKAYLDFLRNKMEKLEKVADDCKFDSDSKLANLTKDCYSLSDYIDKEIAEYDELLTKNNNFFKNTRYLFSHKGFDYANLLLKHEIALFSNIDLRQKYASLQLTKNSTLIKKLSEGNIEQSKMEEFLEQSKMLSKEEFFFKISNDLDAALISLKEINKKISVLVNDELVETYNDFEYQSLKMGLRKRTATSIQVKRTMKKLFNQQK